jgi:Uma2 family endonuclease
MPVSERTFRQVVLEDPEHRWELHDGRLREKPSMTASHNSAAFYLAVQLATQLDRRAFEVRTDSAHVRVSPSQYYIPDVVVIPAGLVRPLLGSPNAVEEYDAPLPLVVEVWSPSTGSYDVTAKLPEYRRRGYEEIWFVHPYERWLRAWRRQPDGRYLEQRYDGDAVVEPASLAGVRVELARLFVS